MRRSGTGNSAGVLLVIGALVVLGAAFTWSTTHRLVPAWSLTATYGFSGTQPDRNWSVYDSSYTGNQDLRDPALVRVTDSVLRVESDGNTASGLCLCGPNATPRVPYGRWDVRARVDADADHGFAILLWPNAENWPEGGEIDIAEFPTSDRRRVEFTVHYGAANHRILHNFTGTFTDWHTFRVDWTPTAIVYYIDGSSLFTVTEAQAIPTAPMHLALQAGPDVKDPSDTSAALQVAWVKTYQAVPASG